MTPKRYALLASLLFAAQAIFAVAHLAVGAKYPPFTHAYSVMTDVVLAVAWATAAVASLTPLTWPAPFLMMCGASVSAMWGFIYTVATNDYGPTGVGLPFLAAAAVEFYCIFRAAPPLTPPLPKPSASRRRRMMAWAPRLRHTH